MKKAMGYCLDLAILVILLSLMPQAIVASNDVHLDFYILTSGQNGTLRLWRGATILGSWEARSGDNIPANQHVYLTGPIPEGNWLAWLQGVVPPPYVAKHSTWYYLQPNGADTSGRTTDPDTGFYIHAYATSFLGCIAVIGFDNFVTSVNAVWPNSTYIPLLVVYPSLHFNDTGVGGFNVPVDKLGLLVPYIGLASTMLLGTVATAFCVRRVKRRKEKE